MNILKRKLSSSRGASMLIAMVFMLFCAFIGGSVLASATANAGRVASLAEQQDFLLERSTAMLMSDQLQLEKGEQLRLHVVDSYDYIYQAYYQDGGGFTVADNYKAVEHKITFTVYTSDPFVTPFQRLMVESAIKRYFQEKAPDFDLSNDAKGNPKYYTLRNLYHNSYYMDGGKQMVARTEANNVGSFWCSANIADPDKNVSGVITLKGVVDQAKYDDVTLPDYEVRYTCGRGKSLYDFTIDFGAESQLKLKMDGFSGTSSPTTIVQPPIEYGDYGLVEIRTDSIQTTISWDDPVIEKGGAA